MSKIGQGFDMGIVVALQVIKMFDQPVIAEELIGTAGGFKTIERALKATENETDIDTLNWLKRNGLADTKRARG